MDDPNSLASYPDEGIEAIAAACSEAQGKFPENVSFKVVLWQHGDNKQSSQDVEDKARRLGQSLEDADEIALEVARANVPASEVEKEFQMVNAFLAYKGELYAGLSNVGYQMVGIALGLMDKAAQRGATTFRPPKFFPIDSYADPSLQEEYRELAEDPDVPDRDARLEQNKRGREALDIMQLHQRAMSLAQDGEQHQIGIVTGLLHPRVGKVLEMLGAQVTGIEVDVSSLSLEPLGLSAVSHSPSGGVFDSVKALATQRSRLYRHFPPSQPASDRAYLGRVSMPSPKLSRSRRPDVPYSKPE